MQARTPYVPKFDGADGGKNAQYMLRWTSTPGEPEPGSKTASVTFGA